MSNEEKRQNQPGEEDSWEALAEDLFGIDFSKAAAQNEPPANDDSSPDETDGSSSVDSGERAETDAEETITVIDSQEDSAAVEETLAVPESSEAAPQPEKPNDDYWDALSDWDWDNKGFADREPNAGRETRSPPPRRRSPAGPPDRETSKRSTPAVAPRDERSVPVSRDGFIDDDDFGLGVLGEVEATGIPPEVEPPVDALETVQTGVGEAVDVEQDEDATTTAGDAEEPTTPKRKKRRRRRRRPRATEHVEETAEAEPDDSEPSGETPPADKVDAAPAADEDDDPLDVDEDVDEDKSPAQEEEHDVPPAHRDLPTWEEAVSYLIQPGQTEARSTETGGTQGKHARSKSDSSKSPGRRSRRRR